MIGKKLKKLSKLARYKILEQVHLKKAGHLGGCLSCVDLIINVFKNYILKNQNDKFVLSKGHCALTLYTTLNIFNKITDTALKKFALEGSYFGEHPSPKIKNKYITFSTGSLGHGLGFGSGLAFSNKLKKNKDRIFVLMSDGELNCGTVWEAALLSSKLKLDNLIAIINYNKFQATGRSNEILNLKPLIDKWKSFGWDTLECDGNDHKQINASLKRLIKKKNKPKVLIANTIKGKGISFMEDDNNWHYRSPTRDELLASKKELEI